MNPPRASRGSSDANEPTAGTLPPADHSGRFARGNTLAALKTVFDCGRLSRAELARQLGLNRSSSGEIVSRLLDSLLIREVSRGARERGSTVRAGRPGILLEIDPEAAFFIGVEIGVEHLTTLQMDFGAGIVRCRIEPFEGRSLSHEDAVNAAIAQAMDEVPPDAVERIEGFGVVAPAQMNASGHVMVAPLLDWHDMDLAALVHARFDLDVPVMIENDANAFAFGVGYRDGAIRQGVTLALVIESGVGGGIVIDGQLFRGGHGLAGEIGHLRVDGDTELEAVLGLGHLLHEHARAIGRTSTSLADMLQDVRDRVPGAVSVADQWASRLAHAIAQAGRLVDPERVILGGSVAALYPLVAARVAHHLQAAQAGSFPLPDIVVHEAADTGAAYGITCMLHDRFLSSANRRLADLAARPSVTGSVAPDWPAADSE